MAFPDTLYTQPRAFQYSILKDRLCGVLTTSRLKATAVGAEKRRDRLLINTNHYDEQSAHYISKFLDNCVRIISMSFEMTSQFIVFEGGWSPRSPRRTCLPLAWRPASIIESFGESLSASLIQRFMVFLLFECLTNRFGTINSICIPGYTGCSGVSLVTYNAESTEVCRPARARFCRWANSRSISRRRQIVLNIVKKRKASQPLSRPDASNENYPTALLLLLRADR